METKGKKGIQIKVILYMRDCDESGPATAPAL